MIQFLWQPDIEIDQPALHRLQTHFTQPKEPMGEAWFMGAERRFFLELKGDLSALDASQLQKPLEEIVSGICCFGPAAEWHDWYHYLLGQLLPRSHETFVSSLLESLVSGFIALYPNGVHAAPYPQFADDVLATLAQGMMMPDCWANGQFRLNAFFHGWNASGDFSASMFFCLKYLPPSAIRPWLSSVFAIASPHWRAQVLVWLTGAHAILHDQVRWPSEFATEFAPDIGWELSRSLKPTLATTHATDAPPMTALLPDAARTDTLALVASFFTEDVFLAWLESISTVPDLVDELGALPSHFEQLYLRPPR